MSILSLVYLGNGYASGIFLTDRLPRTAPVIRTTLLFWYLCFRTYEISTPFQNSTVLRYCNRMHWCDCNRMDFHENSIGPFVHDRMIDFKYGIFHIQIRSTNFPMVMWWVMFREIISHFLASCFPINEKVFLFHPFLYPKNCMSVALDLFCLIIAVTMPSAVELSVFIRVGGWVKPSSWSEICSGTAVFPLCNIPPTYYLAAAALEGTINSDHYQQT